MSSVAPALRAPMPGGSTNMLPGWLLGGREGKAGPGQKPRWGHRGRLAECWETPTASCLTGGQSGRSKEGGAACGCQVASRAVALVGSPTPSMAPGCWKSFWLHLCVCGGGCCHPQSACP